MGLSDVCAGSSIQLGNSSNVPAAGKGIWSSSDSAIATVNKVTGLVTGSLAGNVTIVYKVTDGTGYCENSTSKSIMVKAIPNLSAINGLAGQFCLGNGLVLSNSLLGGLWTISDTTKATINNQGKLNSIDTGDVIVNYTITSNGCTSIVNGGTTIVGLPTVSKIVGANQVVKDSAIQLLCTPSNGIWSSGNPTVAMVGTGGLVKAISLGSTTIMYKVINGNGCLAADSLLVTVIAPLPIESISLETFYKVGKVLVKWSTLGEANISGFAVQRSLDGSNFETIGKIESEGKGNNGYQYLDNQLPNVDKIYYQIISIYKDAKKEFNKTKTVVVKSSETTTIIYPNPTKDRLYIQGSGVISLKIVDVAGKIVASQITTDNTNTFINLNRLTKGIYNLVIEKVGSKVEEKKFVKE